MSKLDKLIVVDPDVERSQDVAHIIGDYADETVVINYRIRPDADPTCLDSSENPPEEIARVQEQFREEVSGALRDRKVLMVVFSIHSCVKAELLKILLELEDEYEFGTRRILYSCLDKSEVNKGFAKRGLPRSKIKHIVHTKEPKTDLPRLRAVA